MRKSNNRVGSEQAGSELSSAQYWVVYDEDTDEYLTSFDDLTGTAKWTQLPGLDDCDPRDALNQITLSARFEDLEEAQHAAEVLVQEISDEYPNDVIALDVRRVEVRHVLHVDVFAGEGGVFLDPKEDGPPILDGPPEEEECCEEECDDSCDFAPDQDADLEVRAKKPKKSKKRR